MRLRLRIAAKLLRAPAMRRAAAPVLVVATLVVALFCALQSLALTGPQAVSQSLGRFDARVAVEFTGKPDARALTELQTAAQRAGASETAVLLQSFDVRPDGNPRLPVTYYEAPWTGHPFPERFRLLGGRWPERPGEVVVSDAVSAEVRDGKLGVLAGNAIVTVVGRVTDDYARASGRILAAPDTWISLVDDYVTSRMGAINPSVSLLWRSADPMTQREAIIEEQARLTAHEGGADSGTRQAAQTVVLRSWLDRRTVLTRERSGPLQRFPLGYLLPSLMLPALATTAAFSVNYRRVRRRSLTFRAIGMPARDAGQAAMLATALACTAMALCGSALGAALGWSSRPALQGLRHSPLAPYSLPWSAAGRFVAVTVATAVLLIVLEVLQQGRESVAQLVARRPPRPVLAAAASLLASFAVVAFWWSVRSLDSVGGALYLVPILVVMVALGAPWCLRMLLSRGFADKPIARLASRRLLADGTRSAWSVALVATTFGSAVSMLALLGTIQATEARDLVSSVPQGQVVISANGTATSPPGGLVDAVATATGSASRLSKWEVFDDVSAVTVTSAGLGSVSAIATATDAQALCQGRLTPENLSVLAGGGFVTLGKSTAAPSGSQLPLYVTDLKSFEVTPTRPAPLSHGDCGAEWNSTTGALLLRSTALSMGLPVGAVTTVVVELSPAKVAAASASARRLGYGPGFVQVYEPLTPAPTPPGLVVTLVGLCLTSSLTVFSLARAQAGALRSYAAGLIALGIPVRWARAVLRRQVGLVVGTGAALAVPVAAAPLLAARWRLSDIVVQVPWWPVSTLAAACVLALGLGVATSTRSIAARERSMQS
ncbi:MAG: hypothetical protein U0Q15_03905 [Kineosporiaceae bacterium]